MTSDSFEGWSVSHSVARISHDLIGQVDSDIELLRDLLNLRKNSSHLLLPLRQLTSSGVVNSERLHDRIYDEQGIRVLHHCPCCLLDQSLQRVHCESPSNHDIFEHFIAIEIVPFGYGFDPLRSESVLSIDVQDFALASTLGSRQLSCDAKGHSQLSFARSKFAKSFSDRLRLYTALKQHIERRRPG